MASVKFYLQTRKLSDQNIDKEWPIAVSFTYDGNRMTTTTGEKAKVSNWDKKKQRIKSSARYSLEVNDYLDTISENLKRHYRKAKILGERISHQQLKNIARNKEESETINRKLIKGLDEFIEIKRGVYALNTIKKFITLRNHLIIFQSKYGLNLEYDAVSLSVMDKFSKYLLDHGLTNNSISTNLKRLKWFLNWATERGMNENLEFRKFKAKEVPGEIFFLEWDELMLLYNHEFESKKLDRVRDAFCFACFSGVRFSDLKNLKKSQIIDNSIHIRIVKTRETLIIPLNDYSRSILRKYKDYPSERALPVLSNQKMNKYLKELGKLVGFDNPITRYYYKGSHRIEETLPKYKVMTTHMARKTFITIAFRQGIPAEIIMKISGHKSHKVLERYNSISEKQKREAMMQAFRFQR